MKQDLDISNIESKPKRDRIRVERKGYNELVAEKERLQAENEELQDALDSLTTKNIGLILIASILGTATALFTFAVLSGILIKA